VVFAWSAGSTGSTRSAAPLPDGQDQLIADVAAVNPDTVVVLNTSGPVAMPWLSRVRAVLEMWYPGDAGGQATAGVLLGRTDPAGHLPFTWPAGPGPGSARTASSGGIFVGYRWYDKAGQTPLFPFGYGLSYTRFRYSRLRWSAPRSGGLNVTFSVTNTGPAASAAVPQIYLGAPDRPPAGAAFALRALAGYTRLVLRPGQTRTVSIHVPQRQLQFWDGAVGWRTAAGQRPLLVSADERVRNLATTVTIPR
jgi:beta-glucosidase